MSTQLQTSSLTKLAAMGDNVRSRLPLEELISSLFKGARLRSKMAGSKVPGDVTSTLHRSIEGAKYEIMKRLGVLYKLTLNDERQKTAMLNRRLEESYNIQRGDNKDGRGESSGIRL